MEMCFGHLLHEANLSKHTRSNLALVFALCCGSLKLVKKIRILFYMSSDQQKPKMYVQDKNSVH